MKSIKLKEKDTRLKAQGTRRKIIALGFMLFGAWPIFILALNQEGECLENKTPVWGYKVVRVYPHDPRAFTQGLVYDQGFLYEGTGLLRKSTLRQVELETGKVVKLLKLSGRLFGEGVTLWENKIIQLTWESKIGMVYDRQAFQRRNLRQCRRKNS